LFSAGLRGIGVGVTRRAIGDAQDATLFVKILNVEVFASALCIFRIVVGIIQVTPATSQGHNRVGDSLVVSRWRHNRVVQLGLMQP
jgi:hypothetical protein